MTTFKVPEMSCGHCKAAIEKAVADVDAAAVVAVDLDSRTVKIDSSADTGALQAAIKTAGYESSVAA